MAFYTRNYEPLCPPELLVAINADTNIGVECIQIINMFGSPRESIFEFVSSLSAPQEQALDDLLFGTGGSPFDGFVCGIDEEEMNFVDEQDFSDDKDPGPDVIWSAEKIDHMYSKKDRVCSSYTGDVIQCFQSTMVPIHFEEVNRCDSEYFAMHHDDGEIEVLQDGWYIMMGGVSIEATSTSRNSGIMELRIDGETVQGSQGYSFHYAKDSRQAIDARGVIFLSANQKVQLCVGRDWGKSTLQTVEHTGRLTLIQVDSPYGSPA